MVVTKSGLPVSRVSSRSRGGCVFEHDTKNLGWLVPAGTTCDWARGLDGVFHLTHDENIFALQPGPLCGCFNSYGFEVVTKFGLPVSRGFPAL